MGRKRATHKTRATGLDGWTVEDLRNLPLVLLNMLTDMLNRVEATGKWPTRLAEGYVPLIPGLRPTAAQILVCTIRHLRSMVRPKVRRFAAMAREVDPQECICIQAGAKCTGCGLPVGRSHQKGTCTARNPVTSNGEAECTLDYSADGSMCPPASPYSTNGCSSMASVRLYTPTIPDRKPK